MLRLRPLAPATQVEGLRSWPKRFEIWQIVRPRPQRTLLQSLEGYRKSRRKRSRSRAKLTGLSRTAEDSRKKALLLSEKSCREFTNHRRLLGKSLSHPKSKSVQRKTSFRPSTARQR